MRLLFITLLTAILTPSLSESQTGSSDSNELRHAPFHLAIASPLSTNGMQGSETVNNVSINLFYAHSAGLKGVEIGGFLNLEKHFVRGFQIGGFSNINLGEFRGIQIGGFGNYGGGTAKGGQVGGMTNIIAEDVSGIQIAGLLNYAGGNLKGGQLSGFLNIADRVNGTQLGFINISDSVESGIPFGFLSIVKDGYNHLEIWGSETFPVNLSAKLGVSSFYNILAAGKRFFADRNLWGIGYGIGSSWSLDGNWGMNADLLTYDVNKSGGLSEKNILHNQLKLNVHHDLGAFEVFAGPSINHWYEEGASDQGEGQKFIGEDIGVKPLDEAVKNGEYQKYWIGGNLGLRY